MATVETETTGNGTIPAIPINGVDRHPNSREQLGKKRGPYKTRAQRTESEDTEDSTEEARAAAPAQNNRDALADPFRMVLPHLTEEQWKNHVIYLYRMGPVTDRTGAGGPKYVCKYVSPIDEERIMREHGSGKYNVQLVESTGTGRNSSRYVFKYVCEIMNPEYPPKIPAGQWVDDPRNEEWKWCKDLVNGAAVTAAPEDVGRIVASGLSRLEPHKSQSERDHLGSQIVELVKNSQADIQKLMDPERQLSYMKSIIEVMRPPAAAPDNRSDKLVDMLLDDRKAAREENRELRTLIMQRPEAPSILDQIEKLEPVMDRLNKNGGTSDKTPAWLPPTLDIAKDVIKAMAPIGVAIAQHYFSRKQKEEAAAESLKTAAQRRAAGARPAAQPKPEPAAAAALPASQPHIEQPTEAEQQPEPTQQESEELQNMLTPEAMALAQKFGPIFQQFVPHMIDQFKNHDGHYSRDFFIDRYGRNWYMEVHDELSLDMLVEFAKFHKPVWQMLQPEDKYRAYLKDFLTLPEPEADDEEENG